MFKFKRGDRDENSESKGIPKVFLVIIGVLLILLIIPTDWLENKTTELEGKTLETVKEVKPLAGDITIGDLIFKYEELRSVYDKPLFELSDDIVVKKPVGEPTLTIDFKELSTRFVKDMRIPTGSVQPHPVRSEDMIPMESYIGYDDMLVLYFQDLIVEEILSADLVKFRLGDTDMVLYVKYIVTDEYYTVGSSVDLLILPSLYNAIGDEGYAFYIGGVLE